MIKKKLWLLQNIFLQEPPDRKIDFFKSKLVSNLDAMINLAKTVLLSLK